MKKHFRGQKGFTLLEILLVVAAIGILAGIVILAINPSKQLGDTRNAQRRVNINTILNAVYQYTIDNSGNVPSSIPVGTPKEICRASTSSDCVDLTVLTLNEKYLTSIPSDPSDGCLADGVCYKIMKTANNRITVLATGTENGIGTISVTR